MKSTVTGMVNTLAQHGYAEKFPSPQDGRVVRVQLTEKGRAIKPTVDRISESLLAKVYGDMPREEREILAHLLGEIRTNIENKSHQRTGNGWL